MELLLIADEDEICGIDCDIDELAVAEDNHVEWTEDRGEKDDPLFDGVDAE